MDISTDGYPEINSRPVERHDLLEDNNEKSARFRTLSKEHNENNQEHFYSNDKPTTVQEWRRIKMRSNKPIESKIKGFSSISGQYKMNTSTYNQMFFPSLSSLENSNSKMQKIDRLYTYYIKNADMSARKLKEAYDRNHQLKERKAQLKKSAQRYKQKTPPKIPPLIIEQDPVQLAKDKEIHDLLNEKELEETFLKHKRKSIESMKDNNEKTTYIDWNDTAMYQNTINNRLKPYNYNHDPKYFTEKEIDYVIEMIQKRESDFIKANLIKAFYFKSSLTLFKLVEYCELSSTRYYDQVMELYNEYNVENTLKLLIRSQKLCRVKDILVQTFKSIHKREEISDKIKKILECNSGDSLDENIQKLIAAESTFLFKLTHNILTSIKNLSEESKFFSKIPFIFDKKGIR